MALSAVSTGLDELERTRCAALRNVRVGLLCHQASVDRTLQHLLPLVLNHRVRVTTLFAPEHGFWGTAQDQHPIRHAEVRIKQRAEDKPQHLRTSLPQHVSTSFIPVHSLYGDHRYPSAEQLADIDAVVCDLQDVGSRYYTFVWTMALAMQACAKHGKRFIVLDRPNPIDGVTLEGPVLDMDFASFVGLYSVPVRHGLTIGEMARWINHRFTIGADLTVIPMKGWRRSMVFEDTGLPWVLPSPNMPTLETVRVYPGGCLLEGTNLSEGRGTTRPFEIFGAPFIEESRLAARLNELKRPGVTFRACRFEPTFHKFAGASCGGVQVHVTDPRRFEPFFTYLTAIAAVRSLYPDRFAWRDPPYEYEREKLPFDILCGTDRIRKQIEAEKPLSTLCADWRRDRLRFRRDVQPFLLYD